MIVSGRFAAELNLQLMIEERSFKLLQKTAIVMIKTLYTYNVWATLLTSKKPQI
jgi:hypothetical protein